MKLTLLILSVLFSQALCADLSFTTLNKEVVVRKGQESIEALYKFTNTSKEAITIRKFDAPCTCLSAQFTGGSLDEKTGMPTYQAGAKGTVKGILELGKFKGEVNKKILIWSNQDADSSPSVLLTMVVKVPYLITAYPSAHSWNRLEAAEEKVFAVKVTDAEPMQIVSYKVSNKNFDCQLETIKEGFEYKLTVTPTSTAKTTFGAIQLTTDSNEPRYKKLQCFVSIKP